MQGREAPPLERDVNVVEGFPDDGLLQHVWERIDGGLGRQFSGADPTLLSTARKLFGKVARHATPQYVYRIMPVTAVSPRGIHVESGIVESRMFSRLARADGPEAYLVLVIATLGLDSRMLSGETSLSVQALGDLLMNEMLEAYADGMDAREWIPAAVEAGMRWTKRFSPGYCDWALEGQEMIFRTLQTGGLRVELSDLHVMIPSKSISAVVLVGKRLEHSVPCVFCAAECPTRRADVWCR